MPLTVLITVLVYPASLALSSLASALYQMGVQYVASGWGQLFVSPFQLTTNAGTLPARPNGAAAPASQVSQEKAPAQSPVAKPRGTRAKQRGKSTLPSR